MFSTTSAPWTSINTHRQPTGKDPKVSPLQSPPGHDDSTTGITALLQTASGRFMCSSSGDWRQMRFFRSSCWPWLV